MSVLNRLDDYSLKNYLRYCQIAIEGFTEELGMFHLKNSIEVVYLHMSTAKTVNMPADMVDWVKIGIPIQGKLRVITRNDNILLPRTFYGSMVGGVLVPDSGDSVGNSDDGITPPLADSIYFSSHWRGSNFIGGLYGLAGGIDDSYYRADYENRQIVFSGSTPRSEIVLEYIGTGLKVNGGSLIPRECVAALRTYILWQKDENDPRVAYNAKERAKREHEEAVSALRSFTLSFTADEYLQMSRSSLHQSPKR